MLKPHLLGTTAPLAIHLDRSADISQENEKNAFTGLSEHTKAKRCVISLHASATKPSAHALENLKLMYG
jgi:hypothetical protein